MIIPTFINSTDEIRTVIYITDRCGNVIRTVHIIRKCLRDWGHYTFQG